jgi:uncharacterized coiled-coil DUF342 family protein
MSQTKLLIDDLNKKVDSLFTKLKSLEEQHDLDQREIGRLKEEVSQKEQTLDELTSELTNLKSASVQPEDTALKFKIDEMVKEIDKCISLLKV